MHKIDSDGATAGNEFTEGSVPLSIPATVVSAAWLNGVQNELVNMIEAYGITLVKGDQDQLLEAITEFYRRGGRTAPISTAINNNQTIAEDVAGFPTFNGTQIQALEFLYSVYRRTDSGVKKEVGRGYLFYDEQAGTWDDPTGDFYTGNGGIQFEVAVDPGDVSGNTFKLQYKSDDLAGGSYQGNLRITDIKVIGL